MSDRTDPNIVSKAEYARLRNCSDAYVSQLARDKKISTTDDGRVRVRESNALLAQNLDPTRGGDRTGKHERRSAGASETPVASMPAVESPTRAQVAVTSSVASLPMAEIKRLDMLAKLRQTCRENALEEGMLVRRDEVDAEAFARARQAQEALMAIPDRLAAQLAGESDPAAVFALLDAELRRVIATITNFGRDADSEASA